MERKKIIQRNFRNEKRFWLNRWSRVRNETPMDYVQEENGEERRRTLRQMKRKRVKMRMKMKGNNKETKFLLQASTKKNITKEFFGQMIFKTITWHPFYNKFSINQTTADVFVVLVYFNQRKVLLRKKVIVHDTVHNVGFLILVFGKHVFADLSSILACL